MNSTTFYIFNQVSVIDDNKPYIYLYNWLNTIGVKIYKKNIHHFDKEKITFKTIEDIDVNFLINNNFISIDMIPYSFYENLFKNYLEIENKNIDIILFPAGYKCNFRCRYCYETHDDNISYSENYIQKLYNIISSNSDKNINVVYFGGEPLLNYKWINLFSNYINSKYKVSYSITTNGYLLSEDLIDNMLKLGIKNFQITLDGLENDHDSMRRTKTNGKTWKKILNNILTFTKFNSYFSVTIRVNFNEKSIDEERLISFLDILSALKYDRRFKIMFRPITDYFEDDNSKIDKSILACRDNPFKRQLDFSIISSNEGFFIEDINLFTKFGGMVCYASKRNSIAIDSRLNILKCTVALHKQYNILGHITDNGIIKHNIERMNNWEKNLFYFFKDCTKCFLFFQCQNRQCARACYIDKYNKSQCDKILILEPYIIKLILSQKNLIHTLASMPKTKGGIYGN